ncbi:MAG TPA: right-handed parallel beta-helix repeat-containing protein [Opitutaceae bacterium]|nr:right-handed parallel beta-helix repeat-containing protein [Opitutaceae bacterium]
MKFFAASLALAFALVHAAEIAPEMAGLTGPVGARPDARRVRTLLIDKPGVYENILVDGEWIERDLVRIVADNVVLRNCTIRHGQRDAVEIYGRNVRVENCHIHHVLKGTYRAEHNDDAHGITGRPLNLTVRNTEISHVSGDALQFDPGRQAEPYGWDNVLVEHCFLWTGPLDADYAGFKRGERPGENAFDSKVAPTGPRARITIRQSLIQGWGHGAIDNGAALNLKEKVQAVIDRCVLVENDIAFRCRGAGAARESAWVTAVNCTVYRTSRVFRLESGVENVKILHLALGGEIGREQEKVPGPGAGFVREGSRVAPPLKAWPYHALGVGERLGTLATPEAATGWNGLP